MNFDDLKYWHNDTFVHGASSAWNDTGSLYRKLNATYEKAKWYEYALFIHGGWPIISLINWK